jgi:recombination associated protein RdgC
LKENTEQGDNADEQFDIDFALMTGEVAKLLVDVVEALGGEKAKAV